MNSESGSESPSKFFTNASIILLNDPALKYVRAIPPTHFPTWFPVICAPSNAEYFDGKAMVWTPSAIAEWESNAINRFNQSLSNHRFLIFLIYWEDEVVGLCNLDRIDEVKKGVWNIGLVLNENARRKGIGGVTLKVMAQVVWDWIGKEGERVECGTMKVNMPFRGLMKRMGVKEIEEEVVVPGIGVVAEVVYHFEREDWTKVDMDVQFGDKLPKKVEIKLEESVQPIV